MYPEKYKIFIKILVHDNETKWSLKSEHLNCKKVSMLQAKNNKKPGKTFFKLL